MKSDPGHIATNAAAYGARPCIKVEIRWDGSNWVDESAYLLTGASGGKSLVGPGEGLLGLGKGSGSAGATFDNRSGRYSAWRSGSQANTYGLYGKLARISAGYYYGASPEYVTVFYGRVSDITETEAAGSVVLSFQDAAALYEQTKVSTALLAGQRTDEWIAALCTALGVAAYTLEKGLGIIPWCWAEEDFGLEEVRAAAQAEGGVTFFDDAGALRFWNATHWIGAGSVATLTSGQYGELVPATDYENVANVVGVEYQPRQADRPAVVHQLERPIYLPVGGSHTVTLQFRTPLATFQGYTLRATAGGDDRASDITVSPSTPQYASGWEVTFTNASTRQGLWVTAFDVYGEPLSGRPAETYTYDASGGATVARRDFRGNVYLQTERQARMLAAMLANRMATPRRSLTLSNMRGNPLLEVGDVVTVTGARTGANLTGIVTGVRWRMGQSYRMDLDVADFTGFYAYSNYWKLGTTNLGSGRVWL